MHRRSGSLIVGSRLVLFQDLSLTVAASLLAILLARWLSEPIPRFTTTVWKWLGLALAGFLAGGMLSGLWKLDIRYMNVRSVGKLVACALTKESFLAGGLLAGLVSLPARELAFLSVTADILLSARLLVAPRFLLATLRREERSVSERVGRKTALVMGTGPGSVSLAEGAEEFGRYNVVGFLTTDAEKEGLAIGSRVVYYLWSMEDLNALQWRLGGIDSILIPRDWDAKTTGGMRGAAPSPDAVMQYRDKMTRAGYGVKRLFDLLLSGLLLVLFSPLVGLCALAVRLEDGGPAIYRQERIGKNGRPFNILKFRSMRTDAEAAGQPALYGGDGDPRLTRVGKFLRQHHLDELPQLWNVFRGDMSFIGYRPERQYYIDQIMERNPRYRYLYQIRPGVTSYATLYNGYTDTLEKMLTRLDLDLYYLRNHSLYFDAKVLGLTFLKIVTGKKF